MLRSSWVREAAKSWPRGPLGLVLPFSLCALVLVTVAGVWLAIGHSRAVSLRQTPTPPYSTAYARLAQELSNRRFAGGARLSAFPAPGEARRGPAWHGSSEAGYLAFAGSAVNLPAILSIQAEVESRLRSHRGVADLATSGVIAMAQSRSSASVALLEEAVRSAPEDPRLLSDLVAARLAEAEEEKNPGILVDALSAAARATELQTDLPEAGYNLALALEALGLSGQAREAWERYIRLDAKSSWAVEARRHLDSVVRLAGERRKLSFEDLERIAASGGVAAVEELVKEDAGQVRQLGEQDLLARWAKAESRGDGEEAARTLSTAEVVGEALQTVSGDSMLAKAVQSIAGAERSDPRMLELLLAGHLAYSEGLETTLRKGCADPEAPLVRAQRLLKAAGSPFAAWANVEIAICDYYGQAATEARTRLNQVRSFATANGFPNLLGRAQWIEGLVAMVQGDLATSLRSYEQAAAQFEKTGERDNVAFINSLLAKDLRLLGDHDGAWRFRIGSLRQLGWITRPDRKYSVLQEAADAATEAQKLEILPFFLNELVTEAEKGTDAENPDLAPLALLQRGQELLDRGDDEAAAEDLTLAERYLLSIPEDFQLLRLLEISLKSEQAQLLEATDPAQAIATLGKAASYYRGDDAQVGERIELIKALGRKARLERRYGDLVAAETDLRRGIEEAEWQKSRIPDPTLRASYQERVGQLYEEMVELQVNGLDQAARGLDYWEQWQSALFSDGLGARSPGGPSSRSVGALSGPPPPRRTCSRACPQMSQSWSMRHLPTASSSGFYKGIASRRRLCQWDDPSWGTGSRSFARRSRRERLETTFRRRERLSQRRSFLQESAILRPQ